MYCLNVYMHTLPMLFFMLQANSCVLVCVRVLYCMLKRVCMIITVTRCCSEHSDSAIPERAVLLRYCVDRGGDLLTRVQTLIELFVICYLVYKY